MIMRNKILLFLAVALTVTMIVGLSFLMSGEEMGKNCEIYGYMPMKDIPAKCIKYFTEEQK